MNTSIIKMAPPININQPSTLVFGIGIFFTLTIIICSFLVYYRTKEVYYLTEHKGIEYFRKGFLFIGFAHCILLLHHIFMPQRISLGFINIRMLFEFFGLLYFIGLSYLFSSMYSKQVNEKSIFFISTLVFFLSFLFHTKLFMLLYSSALIFLLGVVSFSRLKSKRKKKYFSQIYVIYFALFLSWLISFLSRVFIDLEQYGKTINISISGIVFIYIAYLVAKKLK